MAQLLKPSGVERHSYCLQQVGRPSLSRWGWVSNATSVFQPSFASLSNIFGRRPMVLVAILFFCIGAIIAAVGNNFTYMLVGRTIQGVGGGGIIALSEIIV